jgi:hypothetical protein
MTHYEAKKYYAYAREYLRQAETAEKADARENLIEISRVWMEAALNERLNVSTRQEQLRSSQEARCSCLAQGYGSPAFANPSTIR